MEKIKTVITLLVGIAVYFVAVVVMGKMHNNTATTSSPNTTVMSSSSSFRSLRVFAKNQRENNEKVEVPEEEESNNEKAPPPSEGEENSNNDENNKEAITTTSPLRQKAQKTILPGELPGYTGWARPVYTLAPTFEIVDASWRDPSNEWIVNLKSNGCNMDAPQHTKFFARAYGPAIIMGRVKEYDHCHYDVVFDFYDSGLYWIEIVVTFSHGKIPHHFPLFKNKGKAYDDPPYEGYYIPGFPKSLDVMEDRVTSYSNPKRTRTCTIDDIKVVNAQDEVGRWVVKDRPAYDIESTDVSSTDISLDGYESGSNGLGILLTYHLKSDCSIPKHPPEVGEKERPLVIFVGDHTLSFQHTYFTDKHSQHGMELQFVGFSDGGLFKYKNRVFEKVKVLSDRAQSRGDTVTIFFSMGLRDIFELCSGQEAKTRADHEELMDDDYTCVDHYKELLIDMASNFTSLPSEPNVFFQTTTAGWPKWGNFGTAWSPSKGQPYPLSPDFVLQFNEKAVNQMTQHFADNVTILDGYWTTYARPDNRLVNPELTSHLEYFLHHPGHQVQKAFLHMWTIVLYQLFTEHNNNEVQAD